jgi:hypothetical protein
LDNFVILLKDRGIPGQLPDPDSFACYSTIQLAELRGVHLHDLEAPGFIELDTLLG